MNKLLTTISLFLIGAFAFAQEEKEYVIENDGSLSFSKVIHAQDGKSKEVLFPIIQAYFSYAYNDGKSVIQTINQDQYYIIGSGVYSEFAIEIDSAWGRRYVYTTPYVIRIDCKDGRIRVIITVTNYDVRESNWSNYNRDVSNYSRMISKEYPIEPAGNPNRLSKADKRWDKVYQQLRERIMNQFKSIEDRINTGNSVLENEDW